ncbi:MAG: MFS transporter [Myxococcales bacterium]|jgi:MFS family permease|nr:MFS transporter [Myxococcales bacterium]
MSPHSPDATPTSASSSIQGRADAPIFTRAFLLTCLASLCGYASFYVLLGTIPLYVGHVGGSELQVGLVVGMFSAISLCVRMPLGRACDEKGKRAFMLGGALVLVLAGFVYSQSLSVGALIASRALHGLGWALFGTAVYALVAETIPEARRGEAMGYYGISSNIAMAVGPAIGFALLRMEGFGHVFAFSSALAVVALLFTAALREKSVAQKARGASATTDTTDPDQRLHADPHAGPKHHQMLERSALLPSGVMGVVTIGYSAIVSFLPLYAKANGVENPGFFFTVYAISLVLSRTFTGRLSDRYGRAAVIIPGIGLVALALMLAAPLARSVLGVGIIGALFGLGFATVQSSMMAMIADRAAPGHRGAAMGTYTAALDLGIGLGALLCGLLSETLGFAPMFIIAGCTSLGAMALFFVLDVLRKPASTHPERPDGGVANHART